MALAPCFVGVPHIWTFLLGAIVKFDTIHHNSSQDEYIQTVKIYVAY